MMTATILTFPMTDNDPFLLVRRTKLGRDQRGLCGPIAVELPRSRRRVRHVSTHVQLRLPRPATRIDWREAATTAALVFMIGCALVWRFL